MDAKFNLNYFSNNSLIIQDSWNRVTIPRYDTAFETLESEMLQREPLTLFNEWPGAPLQQGSLERLVVRMRKTDVAKTDVL
jgi:hypothetical protein